MPKKVIKEQNPSSLKRLVRPMTEIHFAFMLSGAESFYRARQSGDRKQCWYSAREVINDFRRVMRSVNVLKTRQAVLLPLLRVFVPAFYESLRSWERSNNDRVASHCVEKNGSNRGLPRTARDGPTADFEEVIQASRVQHTPLGRGLLSSSSPCPLCGQEVHLANGILHSWSNDPSSATGPLS
jgi:hypothetical protein